MPMSPRVLLVSLASVGCGGGPPTSASSTDASETEGRTTDRATDGSSDATGRGSDASTGVETDTGVSPGGSDWTWVAANGATSCARAPRDSIWCWGSGASPSGPEQTFADTRGWTETELFSRLVVAHVVDGWEVVPMRDSLAHFAQRLGSGWSSVAAGGIGYVFAIRAEDRALVGFGEGLDYFGDYGEAGSVLGESGEWQRVWAGIVHVCATRKPSDAPASLWCMGAGPVGDGTDADRLAPVSVAEGNWVHMHVRNGRMSGVRDDGTAWYWGADYDAPNANDLLNPTQLGADSDWKTVYTSNSSGCGLKEDGSRWCWGLNLGIWGGANDTTHSMEPVHVDDGWTEVEMGGDHGCGLKPDMSVWCWGANNYGQVGQSIRDTDDFWYSPVQVLRP